VKGGGGVKEKGKRKKEKGKRKKEKGKRKTLASRTSEARAG
jgi:hypothetical protein